MNYNTAKQTLQLDDALLELGVLGLLEIEGQKLLQENELLLAEDAPLPTTVTEQMLDRHLWVQRQKERFAKAGHFLRPHFVRAAVLFFAVCLGSGSVIVASADVRKALYKIVYDRTARYIEITQPPVLDDSFKDLDRYKEAGSPYGVTYVPEGVSLTDAWPSGDGAVFGYNSPGDSDKWETIAFIVSHPTGNGSYRIDSENADRIEEFIIGDSVGLLIVKGDFTTITWFEGGTLLDVYSNLPTEEVIKFAMGIKKI